MIHKPVDPSADIHITEVLKKQKTILSAEVIPPRNGLETNRTIEQLGTLKEMGVDFVSVTKGAGGSLRGGTLPIAQLVRQEFQTCSVAHFTCRDYTIEEIENNLMDHYYFGIKNILALRGDPPDGQPDHFKPAPNRHQYAYELVRQIKNLNEGKYLVRQGYDKGEDFRKGQTTDFCIGVAAYPEEGPFDTMIERFKLKVDSGAQFAITQMLFDHEPYVKFLEATAKKGCAIPTLPGIRVINNPATAERMRSKFHVNVPQKLIDDLNKFSSVEDRTKVGLDFTTPFCENLLKAGAPGIHIFIMNDEKTARQLVGRLKTL